MPGSADIILILGGAGVVLLPLLLFIALWRLAVLRRRLQIRNERIAHLLQERGSLRSHLEQSRHELTESRLDHRAQSVELQQTHARLEENLEELSRLRSDLTDTHHRYNSLLTEHADLQVRQEEREDRNREQI